MPVIVSVPAESFGTSDSLNFSSTLTGEATVAFATGIVASSLGCAGAPLESRIAAAAAMDRKPSFMIVSPNRYRPPI